MRDGRRGLEMAKIGLTKGYRRKGLERADRRLRKGYERIKMAIKADIDV